MRRQTSISSNSYIIVFVQGFIGNLDTELSTHIQSWSIQNSFDFWSWNFKGHDLTDLTLSTLSEQMFQLTQEINTLTTLYPNKTPIFITHSQGSYLTLKFYAETDIVYPTICLNPAFNLRDIILTERLTEAERTSLQNGTSVFKEFSPKKCKWLTPSWYEEYANLETNFQLKGNSIHTIWGTEDTIISHTDKDMISKICNPSHTSIKGDHSFSQTHSLLSEALSESLPFYKND